MKKVFLKLTSILLATGGIGLLVFVFAPLVSYNIKSHFEFQRFLSPVPEQEFADFTNPSSWFPTANAQDVSNIVRYYNLSIPKLGIKDAVVTIGGEDLADSLIQYPGTALPGKTGNAVVFGHSVLPAFYDPKLYLTIFSTLPTMKKKDVVNVNYDGISYRYLVESMHEVAPDDLNVLSQETGSSYISLITCVPPGDPRSPRRLVVRAKLDRDFTGL